MEMPAAETVLDRMVRAVEAVRDRLLRATSVLEGARLSYAAIGDNAVAAWIARVDPAAVRNTQSVDILIGLDDLPAARTALEAAGFVYRPSAEAERFLDGPQAKPRDAVCIQIVGARARPADFEPMPEIRTSDIDVPFRVLPLESLVRISLSSFRTNDRVNIRDLIDVGLVDDTWPDRLPSELAERLRTILANPEG